MVGWKIPFNDAELQMLREGNVIRAGGTNALVDDARHRRPRRWTKVCASSPTRSRSSFPPRASARSSGSASGRTSRGAAHSPETLFALFRTHFDDVTPVFVDAKAEPRSNDVLDEGETVTLALPMRGHVQVRVRVAGGASRHAAHARGASARRRGALPLRAARQRGAVPGGGVRPRRQHDRLPGDAHGRRPAAGPHLVARRGEGGRDQRGNRAAGRRARTANRSTTTEARAIERWVEEIALRRKRAENAARIERTETIEGAA